MSRAEIREKRVEMMFEECKSSIINSTLGAFGLNMGMFSDRDGGNVTTMHNFEQDTDTFVADRDRDSYLESRKEFDRSEWKDSSAKWSQKRAAKIDADGYAVDGYTGQVINSNEADLDHITPLKHEVSNKKNHLAYNTGTKKGKDRLKEKLNSDENLTMTHQKINRAKGAKTNEEFYNPKRKENESNDEYSIRCEKHREKLTEMQVDKERMENKQKEAEEYIATDKTLFKKQASDLIETGVKQAGGMAVKQALGLLLTKTVNILFLEVKCLYIEKKKLDFETLGELGVRVKKHAAHLAKEIPSAIAEGLKGGVSGFISNLLTFLINHFISTYKRLVTIIREGLLGIYQAVKIIFFPPKGMSKEDIWRSAIKVLSTTVLSALVMSFTEAINVFLKSIGIPFTDIVSGVLIGILSGLLSAVVAYLIDRAFDSLFDKYDENMIDNLVADAEQRKRLADNLLEHLGVQLELAKSYDESIGKNQIVESKLANIGSSVEIVVSKNTDILDELSDLMGNNSLYLKKTNDFIVNQEATVATVELFLDNRIVKI